MSKFKILKIGQIYVFPVITWDKLWVGIRPIMELFIQVRWEVSYRERVPLPLTYWLL